MAKGERGAYCKGKIQMEKEISRLEGKLSNQGFLAKAPEAVVAKKRKLEEYKQNNKRYWNVKRSLKPI